MSEKNQNYTTSELKKRKDVEEALAGSEYRPSQEVEQAKASLKEWQEKRPEEYQSAYREKIDGLTEKLLERPEFQYHYTQDPLYRQYAQLYAQNARNASADAAAQVAALTGGYGSSYAVSAAQQAYQQQIGALNDAVPALYRLALETYQSGGDLLGEQLDQLNRQEQDAQKRYERELSDYYTELEQRGNAYNDAYDRDRSQYLDYLDRLDALYDYYSAQERKDAESRQQRFNNAMGVLGLVGDAAQLAVSGTVGLGTLAGKLMSTEYDIYDRDRAYEADRADAAWSQKMQEQKRQDGLLQQQYDNQQAAQQYQAAQRQQQIQNELAAEKLKIAQGEWELKQSKANQSAEKGKSESAARSSSLSGGSLSIGKSGISSGSTVPYSAARMRSQGKSDAAIRTELLKEGYSSTKVQEILRQMNR